MRVIGFMNLFTKNLEELFRLKSEELGRELTLSEVEVRAQDLGLPITKAYLNRLLNGDSSNPTFDKILALSKVFEVEPEWFFTDNGTQALKSRTVAFKSRHDPSLDDVMGMLNSLQEQMEQINAGKSASKKNGTQQKKRKT